MMEKGANCHHNNDGMRFSLVLFSFDFGKGFHILVFFMLLNNSKVDG